MAAPFSYVLKVTRFTNDAAGLEKTLRFLQSLTLIIVENSVSPAAAAPWSQARKQFALGRRYLRFTKFIDCFVLAYSTFTTSSSPLAALLEVGKWSCLGIYLLLESCTILEAMGVWTTEWAPKLFLEAMKFWFYSLSFSLVLSIIGLWSLYTQTIATPTVQSSAKSEKEKPDVEEKEAIGYWQKKDQEEHAWNAKRRTIARKIIIDACDLFIPGVAVGWVSLRPDILGAVMVTSTVLASVDIWARVNPE